MVPKPAAEINASLEFIDTEITLFQANFPWKAAHPLRTVERSKHRRKTIYTRTSIYTKTRDAGSAPSSNRQTFTKCVVHRVETWMAFQFNVANQEFLSQRWLTGDKRAPAPPHFSTPTQVGGGRIMLAVRKVGVRRAARQPLFDHLGNSKLGAPLNLRSVSNATRSRCQARACNEVVFRR